jgi:hypothetical protein
LGSIYLSIYLSAACGGAHDQYLYDRNFATIRLMHGKQMMNAARRIPRRKERAPADGPGHRIFTLLQSCIHLHAVN